MKLSWWLDTPCHNNTSANKHRGSGSTFDGVKQHSCNQKKKVEISGESEKINNSPRFWSQPSLTIRWPGPPAAAALTLIVASPMCASWSYSSSVVLRSNYRDDESPTTAAARRACIWRRVECKQASAQQTDAATSPAGWR